MSVLSLAFEQMPPFRLRKIDYLQAAATVLAVVGVLLNNSKIIWCFPIWIVSNQICLYFHLRSGLGWLAVRDIIFTLLGIAGWYQWSVS